MGLTTHLVRRQKSNQVESNSWPQLAIGIFKSGDYFLDWKAIAIDGPGGSGKSNLAGQLSEDLGAAIIPMDAFLLPPENHRYSAIAKNYDLDRFQQEVIAALENKTPISYGHQNLESGAIKKVKIPVGQRVIVEGIYCLELRFRAAYDFSIFVDTPKPELLKRGMGSELGEASWLDKWLIGEETYLEAQSPGFSADLVLDGSKSWPQTDEIMNLLMARV